MTELERLDGIIKRIKECIEANQEPDGGDEGELAAYVEGLEAALSIVEKAANALRCPPPAVPKEDKHAPAHPDREGRASPPPGH